MIYVLISEFLPTLPFLFSVLIVKRIFHVYKMHLFSNSHMLFINLTSTKEISAGNYLRIYQGSQTLNISLDPWEERLSLDNSVEIPDDLCVHVSTVCCLCACSVCVCRKSEHRGTK